MRSASPGMSAAESEDVLDPEGMDDGEESPFRRRARPVRVRRRRLPQRLLSVGRWMLVAALLLAPLGYGGFRLASYALTSPRFRLVSPQDVQIQGSQYVSREEVLNALGLSLTGRSARGVNVFRLSLERERRQLESLAWVKSATLERAYPHRLVVQIVERTPVAFVNVAGQVKLVDSDGVLLDKPERADFAFPVIDGLEAVGNLEDRQARLSLFQTFVRQMSENSGAGWLISEVDLSDAQDLKTLLVQGRDTILVHFGEGNFSARFQEFLKLLPDLRAANSKIYSVDLRYRDQVVVNPHPETSRSSPAAVRGKKEKK